MAETIAVLGGGCFWCLEPAFWALAGVTEVESGYAGGHVKDPTYEEVCAGDTGHAEVVRIVFDPAVIGYRDLLAVFFSLHDPTTPDRQGDDVGPQYRSVIFTTDPAQAAAATAFVERLARVRLFRSPIVTEIVPLSNYAAAESYHQRYFEHHPGQPYCAAIIAPKIAKFRRQWAERLRQRA